MNNTQQGRTMQEPDIFKVGDQVQRKHDKSGKVGTVEAIGIGGFSHLRIRVRWNLSKHSTKVYSFNIKHYKP